MTADVDRKLSSIDVVDPEEHARLDAMGNRAILGRRVTTPASVPALFSEQVMRAPDAVAISCGERLLTYRELDGAANQLAHKLISLRRVGVDANVRFCGRIEIRRAQLREQFACFGNRIDELRDERGFLDILFSTFLLNRCGCFSHSDWGDVV